MAEKLTDEHAEVLRAMIVVNRWVNSDNNVLGEWGGLWDWNEYAMCEPTYAGRAALAEYEAAKKEAGDE